MMAFAIMIHMFIHVDAQQVNNLAASINCTGINFSWQGTHNFFCIQVQRRGGSYQPCLQNTSATSYFLDSNTLVSTYLYYPGVQINWQVTGTRNGNTGSAVQASINSNQFYDVPWINMSTPTSSFINSNDSMRITWSSASNANSLEDGGQSVSINGYLLEISSDGGSTYSTLATINNVNTVQWFELVPSATFAYNTAYRVRVYARNTCGTGRFPSSVVSFTTPGDVPQVAPTGLTCTVNDGNTITFTWSAIPNTNAATGGFPVTSYLLEWSNMNGTGSWQNVQNTLTFTSSQTNFNDNGWYNYRISAVNSRGQGVSSANVTILTPMSPPFIAPPTIGLQNCTHIRFDWGAPNAYNAGRLPIINYKMQWKFNSRTNSNYSAVPGMTSPYTALNYALPYASTTPLMAFNTLYDFQLASENSMGASPWSTVLTILTPTNPGTMSAPSIATTDITPTKITIKWTALTTAADTGNCTISGYVLEYSNTNNWIALTTNTYTSLFYEWTSGFAQNTNYNFRVTAWNAVGTGTPSGNTSALTDTIPGAANTPSCAALDINPTNITLNWVELTFGTATGRDSITYYKLEWWDQYATTKAWVTVNTVVNLTTSAMHALSYFSGVFPSGSTQTYRLSAMNGVGFGPVSANATCVADSVPSGMGDLTASSVNPLNITITWNDLTGTQNGGDIPVFYLLQYYNVLTASWINLTTDGVTGKVLTFTHVVSNIFDQYTQQRYQVRPKNGVGWGTVFSNVLLVTTDKVPQQMSAVTVTSIYPTNITLSWSDLTTTAQNGGDVPHYYQVEWLNPSTGLWNALTNEAMGKYTSYTHVVAVNFASNSNQQYKVTPKNGVGWGVASASVSCTADREPQAMNTPTVVYINPLEIRIQWADLSEPDNGRDAISFYLVEWDQGLGTSNSANWQPLNTEAEGKVTTFTHTRTVIFTSGAYFNYRVRPKNGVGWGPYSAPLQVQADTEPTFMNTPEVTISNINPTWILITWASLSTDAQKGRNEPIYYGLEWNQGPLNNGNIWVNLTFEALGLTNSFNQTSIVPFQNNTTFKYRAFAMNELGRGPYSSELSLTTDNTPTRMNTPTNVSVDYNSITLTWSPIISATDTGGDPVIYYYVDFFNRPCYASDLLDCSTEALDLGAWTEISSEVLQGAQTTFTHTTSTKFKANQNFDYRVCAKNRVGLGACSSILSVLTDDIPQQMASPQNVTVQYNSITIRWPTVTDSAASGRSSITLYRVQWDTYGNDPNTPWSSIGTVTQDENLAFTTFTHIVNPHFVGKVPVKYRVQAENNVGAGPWSEALNLITDDVPLAMPAPIITADNITATQISIYWLDQALTDIGGDTIQYYWLEWDAGQTDLSNSDSWYELTNPSAGLVLSHILNCNGTSFPNNTDFRFRLRSRNGVGLGPWSPITTITTDRTPLQPLAPTNGAVTAKSISLSWSLLSGFENTGRDPITNYLIEYFNGISWTIVTEVDAITTSFSHTLNDPFPSNTDRSDFLVKYRITAKNGVGYGIQSPELYVLTDTYPRKMEMAILDGEITPLQIPLRWNRLLSNSEEDTGRDPLQRYKLYWQEEGTTTWVELTTGNTDLEAFVITNIPKINTNYLISVAAENNVGISVFSDPLIVLTDNVPTRMNTPVEDPSTNANYIKVTWASITDEVDTGRDPVIYYQLEWDRGTDSWETLTTPNVSVNSFELDTANDGVQNGTSYKFRVTPMNRAGFGAVSQTLTIIPSSPPDKMSQITISPQWAVSSIDVQFSVAIPQTNGAPITSYILQVRAKNNQYFTSLAECDGSSAGFVASRSCKIAHATLRASPFSLVKGDGIVAIANAANLKGYNTSFSDPTSPITAFVEDIPNAMSAVTRNSGSTSWDRMTVQFSGFSANSLNAGGQTCSILSYHVQRDQGNNTANLTTDVWTDIKGLATNDTSTSVTTTSGIVGGSTYKVRVRALNKHGWGPWSPVANIRCASRPNAPATVTTTNSSLWVVISWSLPFNNGLDITQYRIEIARKSGTWSTSSECDGTTNSTIVSTRECQVLMTTLRTTSTYNYVYNDVPVFRVFAMNAEGWSSSGTNSSGSAALQTEPLAPSLTVTNDPSQTNDLQIRLQWTAITGIANWRGYEVHAYEIWWTDRDGTFPYELLYTDTKPFQLTFTHKNKGTTPDVGDTPHPTQPIIGGTRYKFRYRAVNIHGPGPFSVESLFFASTIPDQLDAATTSLLNQTVTIAWNPTPNDHKQAVTAYRVRIRNKAGTFVEDTSICNGVKSTVVSSLKCTALMSLFTTNLNLAIDDLIVVQVEAQNVMGYSIPSPSNTEGVTAKRQPQTAPSQLSRGQNTGKTVIHLNWVGISANVDTGGQDVDYKVYFDKSSGGSSWFLLADSTTNLTTFTDSSSFTVGKAYQFKVAAFNDFGIGPQSSAFTVWAAIAPSGLAEPTTTLNLLTYVEEDDIILIDWVPPTDDGGLTVSYRIEVLNSANTWIEVDQPSECSERGAITNYFLPQATAANSPTQCQMLVSRLKSKWGLAVGATVISRITAFHVVGSVSSSQQGSGTAVIPHPPCFRTTFPRILGGSNGPTSILAMDIDNLGNIVAGGFSQDSGLIGKTVSSSVPTVHYIAKGNYYAWAKYIETHDGSSSSLFTQILDVAFRYDGQRIAASLDRSGYAAAYFIVVLNQDGSLFGAFRENTLQRGKVNITTMLFDNSNFITLALDASADGTESRKFAQIVRFPVASPSATSIASSLYLQGGATGRVSQSLLLQRIRADASSIYTAAIIQDSTGNRRSLLARLALSNGAVSRFFQYTTQSVAADYNSDQSIAGIRRMSLYEDDISTLHIVGACIVSQDGQRIHFGQFIFSTNQLFTVLTPSSVTRWFCLGMFQRSANTAFALINDRSSSLATGYTLNYGRIDYINRRIDLISIINHNGPNTYYGAMFVHMSRFYYWGDTTRIVTGTAFSFSQSVGFINLFDQQETQSCTSSSQNYNFTTPSQSVTLDPIVSANMNWLTTGYTSGPNFAAQSGKTFRSIGLSGGLFNLNLKEPISNNTFCPIVSNPAPVSVQGPSIPTTVLTFNPDATTYPNQEIFFSPFTVNRVCPDQVNYYSTFLASNSQPLPSFMNFDPANTKYIFSINSPSHVGTYDMILQATIGNNRTTEVTFRVQVASPCLGLNVVVPTLANTPTFDISDLTPMEILLNWQVINPPTPSCGELNFIFRMFNNTQGGVVDTSVFTIENRTNGIQVIRVWTQQIRAAKLWTDLMIEARLQGDIVKTHVYSILITNKCAATRIDPVPIQDQIYYTGRDPIDITFSWPETIGVCGPISYSANEYLPQNPASNSSLDPGVFAYPRSSGANNTLRIFTWDDSKVGVYQVRVWASLGVGGFQQSSYVFSVQIVKDPCSYFPYVTSFVEDLTLWVNQTNQIVRIPPFTMNDTAWVCNFTYEIRTGLGTALDPIFVIRDQANQGDGTNITLVTTDRTKVDLSPQTVRVRGWPKRQNTTSQSFTFRIFVAFLDRTDCSPGKYYNSLTETCLNCQEPCSSCRNSANQCTWCIQGYTLNERTSTCLLTTSLTECPSGTLRDPYLNYCRQCPEFCATCSTIDNCTTCVRGYFLGSTDGVNFSCYPPKGCPSGFRSDDTLGCVPCAAGCASCPSISVCNLCKDGFYLNTLTRQCVASCPTGYYADAASKVCMVCSPACRTCVNNNYTCTSCQDLAGVKHYLFGNTCVTRCPYIGYFQNEPARSCDPCKSACKICVNAIDDCVVCNTGSVISGRECLNSCPAGYYITVIGTCFQCDPSCQRCYGSQNSMCYECVAGQYLTQTTCENKCSPPLFPDNATKRCLSCPYYCNQCTNANNCMRCKTGYKQEPQDCTGEMFLRLTSSMSLSLPLNTALVPENFDPKEAAFEMWFRADNIMSMLTEVIVGLSPYKLRKKNGVAQIQLNFGDNNFCDSKNLRSNQWYHVAFSLSEENGGSLSCYIDGELQNTGQVPISIIATDVQRFKEISFGTSVDIKTSESRFNGYVKEFRWWRKVRNQFQFQNFKNVGITTLTDFNPPNELLAYWKFDEKRSDSRFTDFASKGQLIYDPTPTGFKVADLLEMREIYLRMCPEGTYIFFNETLGYFNCSECHQDCANCNGPTNRNCTSCVSPFKLLQTEQRCIISGDCPKGFYQDANKNCWPCHPYCTDCYGADQFQCTACNRGYFKAYRRAGCVSSCPRGLYGNYITQSCSANPQVTSLYPEDGLIMQYGTFIDLHATYQVLNEEPRSTYSYGWIVTKLSDAVDIAKDATKTYYGEDILRVHLDNNIIEPNNYYNITFYVKGNETVYNGMIGSMFNVIYIGIPPKGGSCQITPFQGVAGATEFTIVTGNWKDPDGIAEFHFFYSLDNGATFLPIPQVTVTSSTLKYVFDPIYKTVTARIKCEVQSLKGFLASSQTSFLLTKRSSVNSRNKLAKLSLDKVVNEQDSVRMAKQVLNIAQDMGQLIDPPRYQFDTKVNPDQCNDELCGFNGRCVYQSFTKQYYCDCYGIRAGRNCSFRNATELELLRNLTLENSKIYYQKASGMYNTEFLDMLTLYQDLMSDDLFDIVHNIVFRRILRVQSNAKQSLDTSETQEILKIVSNMLEYLDYDTLRNNVTGSWNASNSSSLYQDKYERHWDNLNRTQRMFKMLQNSTLYQLSFLQTQIQMSSRKLSYKQVLTSKDTILSMPATDNIRKQFSTFVKISPANFKNTSVALNDEYIAEAIEYSVNPFQMNNYDRISTNVFEVNLYNQNRTVIDNQVTKVEVRDLTVPIEFSFPASDNQNLTEFLKDFNALSPFRNVERLKREEMVAKSGLTCVYWNTTLNAWSRNGCVLSGIDKTHIKCSCNHLSAFAIFFQTPKLTMEAPLLNNSTVKAEGEGAKTIMLADIIKWPLDAYFANMAELWQHARPSFLSFILKPGCIVLGLFWAMYLSSLVYYSGRDDLKRYAMTKSQNRDDLAELKDDDVQSLMLVIRDLIVRDFLDENGKYIAREARRMKAPQLHKKQISPPQIKIYEQMSKEEKKKYKKRARRKVFGVPAGLCDRAKRFYDKTMKHNASNPNAKMSFFNEELKNNFWIGLVAKTSKIAPRHVRLAVMYLYASLHIILITIIFAFQLQEYISESAVFQVVVLSLAVHLIVWVIAIPVALIFRMPLRLRKQISGVRSKKINKAFREIDKQMGCRYAVGYFICLTFYLIMTLMVIVFNLFYPQDYVLGWAFNILLIYIFDLVVFTFGLATLQITNIILSTKYKCWYNVWAAIEVFRYIKNLRG